MEGILSVWGVLDPPPLTLLCPCVATNVCVYRHVLHIEGRELNGHDNAHIIAHAFWGGKGERGVVKSDLLFHFLGGEMWMWKFCVVSYWKQRKGNDMLCNQFCKKRERERKVL